MPKESEGKEGEREEETIPVIPDTTTIIVELYTKFVKLDKKIDRLLEIAEED